MAGMNIPGLNEKVMKQMMRRQNAPINSPSGGLAESEYMNYKNMASPAMGKMTWPSLALSLITDPSINAPVLKGIGKISATAGGAASKFAENAGPLAALAYLGPKVLSEGMKSRRHAHERTQPRMGGVAGNTLRGLELASSVDYLMRLPGWGSMLAGVSKNALLAKSPRIANFLTGTAGNVMSKGNGAAVEGGGILNKGYEGIKGLVDNLTGGHISGALAGAARKGGIAGAAAGGAGLLNKGIAGLLGSPTGIMMGMAGLQVGLSIYKSIKMAKLSPNRVPPDNFAKRFYNPAQTSASLNKILMLNPGTNNPQAMSFILQQKSFMIQQLQVTELMKINMQLAGFRGEYHSETDFIRQEREKGEDRFSDVYGKEVYGEDDRGIIMRGLDRLSHTITYAKNTFDPFTQLTNFAFGLLRGKMILPGHEVSKMAKIYGYDDENKMMKEKSESFGTSMDQTRLLHTPGKAILDMAQTYESKMMALGVAQLDMNRYMLAELMTIRISGYGIDQNILHRNEPGAFKQFMTDMFEKLNPMNLPGVNALFNMVKGVGKFAFQTLPSLPAKMMEGLGKGTNAIKGALFGEAYENIKSDEDLRKASGLWKDDKTAADEFTARGLPGVLAELRHIQMSQLEIQQNMLEVQMEALELQGKIYDYKNFQGKKKDLLVWDSVNGEFTTIQQAQTIEKTRQLKMETTREEAFSEGFLGKLLFLKDLFTPGKEAVGLEAGKSRMSAAETRVGRLEDIITGERTTFKTTDVARNLSMAMSSLQPRVGIKAASEIEEDTKRQMKFKFTDYIHRLTAGVGMAGVPAALLLLGAAGPAAGIAAISAAAYVGLDLWKTRRVAEAAAGPGGTGFKTFQEEFMFKLSEASKQDATTRASDRQIGGMRKKGDVLSPQQLAAFGLGEDPIIKPVGGMVSIASETNRILSVIASFLGVSDTNNLYHMFAQDKPIRLAQVQVIDENRVSVFGQLQKGPTHSVTAALYRIEDYLGDGSGKKPSAGGMLAQTSATNNHLQLIGKELGANENDSIYTALAPKTNKIAEVSLHKSTFENLLNLAKDPDNYQYKEAAEKGSKSTTGDAYLVGEKGPEVVTPPKGSVITPNDKLGGIFGGIYKTLQDMLHIDKAALSIDEDLAHAARKDSETQTFFEKMTALKDRMKEKAQGIWQKDVLDLLRIKKKDGVSKDGKKEEGGIFRSIWDFIKSSPRLLTGILVGLTGVLGKLLWDMLDEETKKSLKEGASNIIGKMGDWVLEQYKQYPMAMGAGTGALIGFLAGGVPGMVTGALVGAGVGSIASSVSEMTSLENVNGEKTTQIAKKIFLGEKEGGFVSALQTSSRYAAMGAGIGLFSGAGLFSIPNAISGALIGAAMGGLIGWLGQNVVGNFAQDIQNMTEEMGWNPYIIKQFEQPGLTFAPIFAKAMSWFPNIGPIIGGMVGTVLDGLVNIFQWGVYGWGELPLLLTSMNDGIIRELFASPLSEFSTNYSNDWAVSGGSSIPVIGAIVGGVAGIITDALIGIFTFVSSPFVAMKKYITEMNSAVVSYFGEDGGKYAQEWANAGTLTGIPFFGPLIGGYLGMLLDIFPKAGKALSEFASNFIPTLISYAKDMFTAIFVRPEKDPDWATKDMNRGQKSPVVAAKEQATKELQEKHDAENLARSKEQATSGQKTSAGGKSPATPGAAPGGKSPAASVKGGGSAPNDVSGGSRSSSDSVSPGGMLTGAALKKSQDSIKSNEGLRFKPYDESKGRQAIGYGHLILPGEDALKQGITQKQADELFESDYTKHSNLAASQTKSWASLNDARRAALIDMTYQMGDHRKIQGFDEALTRGDYSGASKIISSSWYGRKFKDRAARNAKLIESGKISDLKIGQVPTGETARKSGDDKSSDKPKGVLDILKGAYSDISKAFEEAFTQEFNDAGLYKAGAESGSSVDAVGAKAMQLPPPTNDGKIGEAEASPSFNKTEGVDGVAVTLDEVIAAENEKRVANGQDPLTDTQIKMIKSGAIDISDTRTGPVGLQWNEAEKTWDTPEIARARLAKTEGVDGVDYVTTPDDRHSRVAAEYKEKRRLEGIQDEMDTSGRLGQMSDQEADKIDENEKVKKIESLLAMGSPIMDPELRALAKEKGLLKVEKITEFEGGYSSIKADEQRQREIAEEQQFEVDQAKSIAESNKSLWQKTKDFAGNTWDKVTGNTGQQINIPAAKSEIEESKPPSKFEEMLEASRIAEKEKEDAREEKRVARVATTMAKVEGGAQQSPNPSNQRDITGSTKCAPSIDREWSNMCRSCIVQVNTANYGLDTADITWDGNTANM